LKAKIDGEFRKQRQKDGAKAVEEALFRVKAWGLLWREDKVGVSVVSGRAGMGVPRKAISQKESHRTVQRLIFEGLHPENPGRMSRSDQDEALLNPQRSVRVLRTL
jgi:hypothetical protein